MGHFNITAAFLSALLVVACDKPPAECTPTDWFADTDSDGYGDPSVLASSCEVPSGYVADDSDCDDTNADMHPGAEEVCDGLDDDCNGIVDDDSAVDATTWYADSDGDGYGDPDVIHTSCSPPSGYLGDDTDCDDTSADVNPGAEEVCDGLDDDCNGTVDDDSAVDATTWYADSDGDGYGDPDVTHTSCSPPSGYLGDDTDCDDTSADVNPGAAENCNGVDDNCDGTTDEDSAVDADTWYADADADGYGDPDATQVSCSAPSGYLGDDTDCDDTSADVHPGASEACNGVDDNCDGTTDEDSAVDARTWHADADGDGYGDPAATRTSCSAPSGYLADDTDCDDTSADVHPGAVEACNGVDDNCDGTTDEDSAVDASTWYADADGDGYGDPAATHTSCSAPSGHLADDTDCDDTSTDVHPGASEACNGGDDNCDGTVDEDSAVDAGTWYADDDGDGYGDPAATHTSCSAPSGYLADDADCDDTSADVHPGAAEACNGVDDNCDGSVDEDSAVDAGTWYADTDGDGYGDPAATHTSCSAPSGHLADDTDCDDTSADVNPVADEACNGIDDNCDGTIDEDSAIDAGTWYADTDADGYGDPGLSRRACALPSGYVGDATDCDDTRADAYPGATESCNGADDDCDGTTDEDSAVDAATWYADTDADGYGDLGITATSCSAPSGYVADPSDCDDADSSVHPAATDTCGDLLDSDCDGSDGCYAPTGTVPWSDSHAFLQGDATYDGAGVEVRGLGDLTGDGSDDIGVGAYGTDVGGSRSGTVYIVPGPQSGTAYLADVASARIDGTVAYQQLYHCAEAGDANGDGWDDLLVGAASMYTSGDFSVFLYQGPLSGAYDTTEAYASIIDTYDYRLGEAMVGNVDLDDDGAVDVALGATRDSTSTSYAGSVRVFPGSISGTYSATDATTVLYGVDTWDEAGSSVASADLDGDGVADLAIGARGASTGGQAYVIYGPLTGDISLADSDAIISGAAGDYLGADLGTDGDIDGDGLPDLVLGAPYHDVTTSSEGAAYLFTSAPSGSVALSAATASFTCSTESYHCGKAANGVLDVDGDGLDELVVGSSPTVRSGASYLSWEGPAYLFYGPVSGAQGEGDADATFTTSSWSAQAGGHLDGAGDLNDDGYGDLIFGAQYHGSYSGAALIFYGGP